jgi:hypothetical protein
MDWLDELEADCHRVAERLRNKEFSKEERKRLRPLLQRIFLLRGQGDPALSEEAIQELRQLHSQIQSDSKSDDDPIADLLSLFDRFSAMDPVRIESAVRQDWLRKTLVRHLGLDLKIQSRVSWFWERCQAHEGGADAPTVQAKAADELDDLGLEFVWGRKKRY